MTPTETNDVGDEPSHVGAEKLRRSSQPVRLHRFQLSRVNLGFLAFIVLIMSITFGDLLISAGHGNNSSFQLIAGTSLFIVGPLIALTILALARTISKKTESPVKHCETCGNNLTEAISGICPECGMPDTTQ